MSGCGCQHEAQDRAQRRALMIALDLNAAMFVVGMGQRPKQKKCRSNFASLRAAHSGGMASAA